MVTTVVDCTCSTYMNYLKKDVDVELEGRRVNEDDCFPELFL